MLHLDPYRAIDQQPDPHRYATLLERRGETKTHIRLLCQFLALFRIKLGSRVLEVGCGTGVVARDLAVRVGPRGRVTGIDPSVVLIREARRLARAGRLARRLTFEVMDGAALEFPDGSFDATLAVTVLLHVAEPLRVLREMVRVTRPGGLVGVQDQDFGSLVIDHPDRRLTRKILEAYARKIYNDPWSGRTMFGNLRRLGIEKVRVITGVYQDTTCEPFTRSLLERRVEMTHQWKVISTEARDRWIRQLDDQVRAGSFFMTLNFYGVVGTKPGASSRLR